MSAAASTPLPAPAVQDDLSAIYDVVYDTDLVYVKDCWQRCGDAHCCNFQRYKSRYRIIGQVPFQELPLLPGEHAYLASRGWLRQFEPFEYRVQRHEVAGRVLQHETLVSRRPGCACDHATRPTVCRLYPLLPRFDIDGRLDGTEPLGIYEDMERIGGLAPACQVTQLPFDQIAPLLRLCHALAASPLLRFHLEAYRITKAHVAGRLAERVAATGQDVFRAFEGALLRQALADGPALKASLAALAETYDRRWPGWDRALPAANPAAAGA